MLLDLGTVQPRGVSPSSSAPFNVTVAPSGCDWSLGYDLQPPLEDAQVALRHPSFVVRVDRGAFVLDVGVSYGYGATTFDAWSHAVHAVDATLVSTYDPAEHVSTAFRRSGGATLRVAGVGREIDLGDSFVFDRGAHLWWKNGREDHGVLPSRPTDLLSVMEVARGLPMQQAATCTVQDYYDRRMTLSVAPTSGQDPTRVTWTLDDDRVPLTSATLYLDADRRIVRVEAWLDYRGARVALRLEPVEA